MYRFRQYSNSKNYEPSEEEISIVNKALKKEFGNIKKGKTEKDSKKEFHKMHPSFKKSKNKSLKTDSKVKKSKTKSLKTNSKVKKSKKK
ncbi:MAG: hypothetical protein V1824_04310 [archaeon]